MKKPPRATPPKQTSPRYNKTPKQVAPCDKIPSVTKPSNVISWLRGRHALQFSVYLVLPALKKGFNGGLRVSGTGVRNFRRFAWKSVVSIRVLSVYSELCVPQSDIHTLFFFLVILKRTLSFFVGISSICIWIQDVIYAQSFIRYGQYLVKILVITIKIFLKFTRIFNVNLTYLVILIRFFVLIIGCFVIILCILWCFLTKLCIFSELGDGYLHFLYLVASAQSFNMVDQISYIFDRYFVVSISASQFRSDVRYTGRIFAFLISEFYILLWKAWYILIK